MDKSSDATEITTLLQDWQRGDQEAFKRLIPLVYDELHILASRQLNREWRATLQTTAVVNEAYLKLFGQRQVDWQNRGHFFALAAQLMRRILVDHARHQLRQKRGSGATPEQISEALAAPPAAIDVVSAMDLDQALQKLERLDPEQGRIVELRFFGGLNVDETAAALGISSATVKRDWAIAKGWLFRELTGAANEGRARPETGDLSK